MQGACCLGVSLQRHVCRSEQILGYTEALLAEKPRQLAETRTHVLEGCWAMSAACAHGQQQRAGGF